jgi:hypothetical protein
MIYAVEGRIALPDEKWVRGDYRAPNRADAELWRRRVQQILDQHCRWKMETRVVEVEGSIFDRQDAMRNANNVSNDNG